MVTECIEDSVVPFYFEVTMGRGDPTVRDKNDVYSSAIHEKSTRLFVTTVPAVAVNVDRHHRLGHTPFILLLMDKGCWGSDISWPR